MVTMTDEITKYIEIGDERVTFTFRRPTPKELNKFLSERYPTDRKKGMRDNSLQARVDFFDLLLTGIDNLSDAQGVIGADRKDAVLPTWKNQLIYDEFEDVRVVDEKN